MEQQALIHCSAILLHSLDIPVILNHLLKDQLVTQDEAERLGDDSDISDVNKVNYLIQILPKKGGDWLNTFIKCLNETTEATGGGGGHGKIVKELQNALKELHIEERKETMKHLEQELAKKTKEFADKRKKGMYRKRKRLLIETYKTIAS